MARPTTKSGSISTNMSYDEKRDALGWKDDIVCKGILGSDGSPYQIHKRTKEQVSPITLTHKSKKRGAV